MQRGMILRLLSLNLLLAAPGLAGDRPDPLLQLQSVDKTLAGKSFDPRCWMDPSKTGKNCNQTSDDFCDKLAENGSNMKVFDGEVRAGTSDKSDLSLAQLDDYNALVKSLPRLPKDLQKGAAAPIAKIKALLATENDSKKWSRDLAAAYKEFQDAVDDAKAARAERGKTSPTLESEIVRAKYERSANWQRVQRLFPQAKEDLLKVLDSLNISDERKEQMKERVRTVELTLPDGSDDCGTTQENAFYTPETHKFTVCAGLFNSYATDSGLFQTIAHEISHSIDNNQEATLDFHTRSSISKLLAPLEGAKGPVVDCGKWDDDELDVLTTPEQMVPPPELDAFYACLEPRGQLKNFTFDTVAELAERNTNKDMSDAAKKDEFIRLGQPDYTEDGKIKLNKEFLRPDLVADADKSGGDDEKKSRISKVRFKTDGSHALSEVSVPEIFTQVLACQRKPEAAGAAPSPLRYQDVKDPKIRRIMFHNALAETQELVKRQKEDQFFFCGKTCDTLVADGFSKDPSESFADWMANRAQRYLFARIDTPEHRQEAAALGNSLLCEEPGPKREAPGLAIEEKKYSTEEHPDARLRRLSEYDAVTAHQLGCTLSTNEGFAPCEP